MENLQYSIWQKPYKNALTELDPLRVAERVAAAEAAIAMRMKQASGSSDGQDELRALKGAREALNTLKNLKRASAPRIQPTTSNTTFSVSSFQAEPRSIVDLSFDETLITVWRQALVDDAKEIVLGTEKYTVRRTPQRKLREVDFVFAVKEIRGLEQNPETKSQWATMARDGKKVMQFHSEGRYVANVVEGKVTFYGYWDK
jgi:hypothetical protein